MNQAELKNKDASLFSSPHTRKPAPQPDNWPAYVVV